MITRFHRQRIGIPGPIGDATIPPGEWTSVQQRLTDVEGLANTTNPYPLQAGVYISTKSHGLGGTPVSSTLTPLQQRWTPVFVPTSFLAQSMSVNVTVGQPGARIRLSMYGPDRSLLASYYTGPAETTGWKEFELSGTPLRIPRGINYLSVQCNEVANVEIMHLSGGFLLYHSAAGAMADYGALRKNNVSFDAALPTVQSDGAMLYPPFLGIKVSSL